MRKLKEILNGWHALLFKPPSEFAARRLKICNECPFNSRNKKGLLNSVLPAFCLLCKCELRAKTACDMCACDFGKWTAELDKDELIKKIEENFAK